MVVNKTKQTNLLQLLFFTAPIELAFIIYINIECEATKKGSN